MRKPMLLMLGLAACVADPLETGRARLMAVGDSGVYGGGVVWEVYGAQTELGSELQVLGIDDFGEVTAEVVLRLGEQDVTEVVARDGEESWATAWGADGTGAYESAPLPPALDTLLEAVETSFEDPYEGYVDDCPTCAAGAWRERPSLKQALVVCARAAGGLFWEVKTSCRETLETYWGDPRSRKFAVTVESVHPVSQEVRYSVSCPPDGGATAKQMVVTFAEARLDAIWDRMTVYLGQQIVDFTENGWRDHEVIVLSNTADIVVTPTWHQDDTAPTWGFRTSQVACYYDD